MQNVDLELIEVTNQNDFMVLARLADEIFRECFVNILPDGQINYMLDIFQSEQAIKEAVLTGGYIYYYIYEEGERIGYISLKIEKNYLFINTFYFKNEYRNERYIADVMQLVKKMALENNVDLIWLRVNKKDLERIKRYESVGFKQQRDIKTDIGNGYILDDFIMELIP